MNKEKMTIHRALADLKTIDDRIEKAISETKFCRSNKHSNEKNNGRSIDDYIAETKSAYESINDLIRRRNAMKRAVVMSNAVTNVTVGDEVMTVAEAIEMKQKGINNIKLLMGKLAKDSHMALEDCDIHNGANLEVRANEYVTGLFGAKDGKTNVEAIDAAKKMFISANTYDFIDPLGANDVANKLYDYVRIFEADVDAALSVSNAITTIEFEY